jgi:hypothetical protein
VTGVGAETGLFADQRAARLLAMHAYWPQGEGPDEEWFRRMSPPENEVPASLPMDRLLARTDDVAVALHGLAVYSTGLVFHLAVRVRPAAAQRVKLERVLWAHWQMEREGEPFLVGIELADGRRATSLQMPEPHSDVVFTNWGSSSSGSNGADQTWWLSPLPPEGPLRVVVRCASIGIAETSTELDATAIRRAAADVVTLWPWEPPHLEGPPEPPPPDLPGDSWFAR